jgi:hypothetical protein
MAAPCAFGAGNEITNLNVASDGDRVRIAVELTAAVKPTVRFLAKPGRLLIDFPNVSLEAKTHRFAINHDGISEVVAVARANADAPAGTRIVVWLDPMRPIGMETSGNRWTLTLLPHPLQAGTSSPNSAPMSAETPRVAEASTEPEVARKMIAASSTNPPGVERIPVDAVIDQPPVESAATMREQFRIKFVAGNTVYIDGGSNSGLRVGMNLDIRDPQAQAPAGGAREQTPIAAARIVAVATTSAILEIGRSDGDLRVGDQAELIPQDAATARRNVLSGPDNTIHAADTPIKDEPELTGNVARNSFRPATEQNPQTRTAGRIGIDYSGISSNGSTPGASMQVGMSFQSDFTHILGSHWNLQGYWRGRLNRHSQFYEPTIEDSLSKTYTMQLYYDNPNSKWVAGMGRLYLPWAVSLDTVDGAYFGRKLVRGNTSGVFAGSTPDLNSWHYRPNQRIAGVFTNFEGGDYDGLHYSSTAGLALTSIKWKLDRPFAFFENEVSYKGKVSAYHSLIVDSPLGASTNGIRPGAGISHSYFTLHYQPVSVVSFDMYHNFFRDVPTALTAIVGTGMVDKLLFQGVSVGAHVKPSRYFTLYGTVGTSAKTGDVHRSLNRMFGGTLNEVGRSGIRADYHYSKFDSNFGNGTYQALSLSRQMTNRMYWNVQLGNQNLESQYSADCVSQFIDDSVDINLGRHSYLQSGYTWVNGETMNYRQWYLSWGLRLDQGKKNPQYIQTLVSH